MTTEETNREILLGGRFITVAMVHADSWESVQRLRESDAEADSNSPELGEIQFQSRRVKVRKVPYLQMDELALAFGNTKRLVEVYTRLTAEEVDRLDDRSIAEILDVGRELNEDFFGRRLKELGEMIEVAGKLAQSEELLKVAANAAQGAKA